MRTIEVDSLRIVKPTSSNAATIRSYLLIESPAISFTLSLDFPGCYPITLVNLSKSNPANMPYDDGSFGGLLVVVSGLGQQSFPWDIEITHVFAMQKLGVKNQDDALVLMKFLNRILKEEDTPRVMEHVVMFGTRISPQLYTGVTA